MPSIFNVGNGYINHTKKIESKLSFNVGEKFSGRIVKNSNGEVSVRLPDGWEFAVDIEGNIGNLENILQKFSVEGYENGKLKLKLIPADAEESLLENKDITDILSKEGLKKSDENILKTMIKFNIPLTKENIKEIKSMIQFLDKIQDNPEAVDNFVLKYLDSKGIDIATDKGISAYKLLSKFLVEYSSLSENEVLMFFENNIDLNSENIEAYKNLLKSENNIDSMIKDIKTFLATNKEDVRKEDFIFKGLDGNDNLIEGENNKVIINSNNKSDINIENKFANDVYQKNEMSNSKISMLSLLKTLSGESEDLLNGNLKDILINRKANFTSTEYEKAFNNINSLDPEEFIKEVKTMKQEFNIFSNNKFVNDLDQYMAKNNDSNNNSIIKEEINITKGQMEELVSGKIGKDIKLSESEYSKLKDVINIKYQELEEKLPNSIENKEIVQSKEVVQNKEIVQNKETSLNGKEINQSNMLKGDPLIEKEANIKENTLGKEQLNPKEVNLNKEVSSSLLTTKEQVTASLNKVSEENKNILKEVMTILKSEGEMSEKLISLIKDNVSDVKVFNKLSEEYYYANIPVKVQNEDYPCRLIIKDKRKDGKKLDSKNLKMIVTVDTKNIGMIEGYLTVLEKKLDVNLKCDEDYMKVLNRTKDKLTTSIENIGFSVNIKISKKEEDVSLSTCRDFFNTGANLSIDRRV